MLGDGFDLSRFESCAPLAPQTLLARSLLWRSLRSGEWDPLEVEELGASLLVGALCAARKGRRAWKDRRPRSARLLRRMANVSEAVFAQPDRRWTLDALASLAQVSPSHLAHAFRRETGSPVYRLVVRARLAKALDAMFDGDADLSTIAQESGFSSHSHFSARFRGVFGLTPQEVRRKLTPRSATEMRKIVTAGTRAFL